MLIANYHTHTPLCRHAKGEAREYVETAIRAGLTELGFSDHTPQIFPKEWKYYSSFRMYPEQLEEYVTTVRDLAEEYKKDIRILLGVEAEYYPLLFDDMLAFLRPYGLDYMILGQHALGNELGEPWSTAPTKDPNTLIRYTEQCLQGLQTGRFTYFAHPDCLNYTEDDALYEEMARKLCLGAKELNVPLEINLLGIREGRPYPSHRFFRIAGECGCTVVLGCDAHSPGKAADLASAEQAYAMAEQYGLRVLDRITPIPLV